MENLNTNNNSEPIKVVTERDRGLNRYEGREEAAKLRVLLDKYKDKRVLVVAPPGAGKSTILQHIPEGVDMDNALFDTMPKDIKDFALQRDAPYMLLDENSGGYKKTIKYSQKEFEQGDEKSEEDLSLSSDFLQTYINSHIKIKPGHPFFATNVIDCDVVVYLKLDDEIYKRRLEGRSKNTNRPLQFERGLRLKDFIERDIKEASKVGVIVEELEIS